MLEHSVKMYANDIWAIHVVGKEQPLKGFWERVIFTQGRIHTFFVLVKDRQEVAELHFTAKKRNGKTAETVNPLNVIQSVADLFGVGSKWGALIYQLNLKPYFLLLKAIETRPRQFLQDSSLTRYGVVEGNAEHILHFWNAICAMALEINKAEILFTHNVNWGFGRKPANCQAASKTILTKLGPEFREASEGVAKRHGRILDRQIPALTYVEPQRPAALKDLEDIHQELATRLYKTSGFRNERS
jgi:hypothetical protein